MCARVAVFACGRARVHVCVRRACVAALVVFVQVQAVRYVNR